MLLQKEFVNGVSLCNNTILIGLFIFIDIIYKYIVRKTKAVYFVVIVQATEVKKRTKIGSLKSEVCES